MATHPPVSKVGNEEPAGRPGPTGEWVAVEQPNAT